MIVRYIFRRLIGALMRLGRTLRGRERPAAPTPAHLITNTNPSRPERSCGLPVGMTDGGASKP